LELGVVVQEGRGFFSRLALAPVKIRLR
jgi:hypothetical protein